jgi:hypothetical protein
MNLQYFPLGVTLPTSPSRREVLREAALLAGSASLIAVPGLGQNALAAIVGGLPPGAGASLLELDRVSVAELQSAEGGFARAEVINEAGPGGLVKKRLGPPRYQDIVIQLALPVPDAVRDWIGSTMNLAPQPRNGAILTLDVDRKEKQRLQFTNATVSEANFPVCDSSALMAVEYLTLKLACDSTAPFAGSDAVHKAELTPKQAAWKPTGFRLSIAGIDCSKVSKVESFSVKLATQQGSGLNAKDAARVPGRVEFSNLTLHVSEAGAAGFYGWYQEMVIKGNSSDAAERQGSLEFLDPSLKQTLQRVNFQNLGILDFSPEKSVVGKEAIRRVRIELYCERMTIA